MFILKLIAFYMVVKRGSLTLLYKKLNCLFLAAGIHGHINGGIFTRLFCQMEFFSSLTPWAFPYRVYLSPEQQQRGGTPS